MKIFSLAFLAFVLASPAFAECFNPHFVKWAELDENVPSKLH